MTLTIVPGPFNPAHPSRTYPATSSEHHRLASVRAFRRLFRRWSLSVDKFALLIDRSEKTVDRWLAGTSRIDVSAFDAQPELACAFASLWAQEAVAGMEIRTVAGERRAA